MSRKCVWQHRPVIGSNSAFVTSQSNRIWSLPEYLNANKSKFNLFINLKYTVLKQMGLYYEHIILCFTFFKTDKSGLFIYSLFINI